MPHAKTNEIRVNLQAVEELFAEPAADPFDPSSRYVSGVDELIEQLRAVSLDYKTRVLIGLPANQITPDLEANTRGAMSRYCTAKIEENQREILELRRVGRRSILTGVVLVGVLMLFGALIASLAFLPETVRYVLVGWIPVAVWVVIWNPADLFFYAWRPYRRARRLYENLRDAELVIQPLD